MSSVSVNDKIVSPQLKPVATQTGKRVSWQNIGIGAAIQVFEVSTLGQPFEVLKTHMAGTRECDSLAIQLLPHLCL